MSCLCGHPASSHFEKTGACLSGVLMWENAQIVFCMCDKFASRGVSKDALLAQEGAG